MRITVPTLDILENEGFSADKDIFRRKDFGVRLANLFENSQDNLVVGLDAPWGEGKSTFIQMWKGFIEHQREEKFKTIYFDAFANDYRKDPFLALASELYELLDDEDDNKKSEFKLKAGNAIKSLTRGALKIGVRAATGGIFDGSVVDSVEEEASKLVADQVDDVVGEILQSNKQDKLALEHFREYLQTMAHNEGDGNPIIFIIDELDRCKPDFALELIEQVKHIFSVKGITFLLVLNRAQLEASVKARYGNDINASLYLQKFVSLWLTLPRSVDHNTDNGEKYLRFAFSSMMFDGEKFENNVLINTLIQLIKFKKPSYREIQQILTYVGIVHNMSPETKYYENYQLAIAFMCYLKTSQPEIFEKVSNNAINFSKLIEEVNLTNFNEDYHLIEYLILEIKFDLADQETKKAMLNSGEFERHHSSYRGERMFNHIAQILNTLSKNN